MPVHSWEPSGEPSSADIGHIEPVGAFDSSVLPGIQTQPDTSTDIRNLVRIEVVVTRFQEGYAKLSLKK